MTTATLEPPEVDIDATTETSAPVPTDPTDDPSYEASGRNLRVFLTRGLVAIAWAAVFAAVTSSVTTALTVGAGVLLVAYPLIDVAGSLVDARSQLGSARRILLANAAGSTLAAVALAVAATDGVAAALAVFGIWAITSGAAQLVVAVRRRALLGKQWPMRLAGGVSVIGGLAFILSAVSDNPRLGMVVVYAATGGVDFVIQAWLLARRRRHLTSTS